MPASASTEKATATTTSTNVEILGRLFPPKQWTMSPAATRGILEVQFSQPDLDRMHELAIKNQRGELAPREADELDSYCRIGLLLDLMKSKASTHARGY